MSVTTNQSLATLNRLARFLDSSIPLPGGFRMGWDAVIGLIPGVGDFVGALLSTYVVAEGVRLGAPAPVLGRMVVNVLLEMLFGIIPVVGDIFDIAFKANVRNVTLLENYALKPGQITRRSRIMFALALIAGLFSLILLLWVLWSLVAFLWAIVSAVFV